MAEEDRNYSNKTSREDGGGWRWGSRAGEIGGSREQQAPSGFLENPLRENLFKKDI